MKNLNSFVRLFVLFAIIGFSTVACKKKTDDVEPEPESAWENKTLISEGYSDNQLLVSIYADEDLFVGMNDIYVVLKDSTTGEVITDGHVTYEPHMKMTSGMSHGAPVQDPSHIMEDMYHGQVGFLMPSGEMGSWTLQINTHRHDTGEHGHYMTNISVKTPNTTLLKTVEINSVKYRVFWTAPTLPVIGVNDFELAVYTDEMNMETDEREFLAAEDLIISMTPSMPDMGHGSPNNVDPTHLASGNYKGTVNFTMSGKWDIDLVIKEDKDSEDSESLKFTVTF